MKAKRRVIGRLVISIVLLAAMAVGIFGCEDRMARMEENQIRLQAMVAANARQLATVSTQIYVNNNEVQEGLQRLDRNDQDLGTGVSTVQSQQDTLRETVASAHQATDKRIATLDENERLLRDGVSQVADITQRTASDVTAIAKEQATLHQMVQSGRQELGESIAIVAANQEKTRTDIGQLQQTDQRMIEQLVALAASQDRIYSGLEGLDKFIQAVANDVTGISQGQTALQKTLDEHRTTFAEKAAILEQNQRTTHTAIESVAGQTKQNTEGIAAVAAGQAAMQQTLSANHKIVAGQIAAVIENQQSFQAGIDGLTEKAGQTASQLAALAAGQETIRETLNSDNGTVAAKLAGLSETQTGLQTNLSGLHQKTDTVVAGVGTIRADQARLYDAVKANHEVIKDQVTHLSGGQQQVQGQLDLLTATAGQTALDVVALGDRSAALQRAIEANTSSVNERTGTIDAGLRSVAAEQRSTRKAIGEQGEMMSGRIAEVVDSQKQLRGSLDSVASTVQQTATDVKAAGVRQDAMQQALRNHNETTARQIGGLADSQQQVQSSLDVVTATIGQTALDVIAMASQQDALGQTLQSHNQAVDGRMTALANGQDQMQGSLDVVVATGGQTALDVIGMAAGQDMLTQNMQSQNAAITGRIADLTDGQQQMQNGLDAVIATAGQTALDVIDLNASQARLAKAVQADGQDLTARLAELVRNQQQWAQRLDAAQANVQAITVSIAGLEEHLAKLQGSLQPSLEAFTSQLSVNEGQDQTQLEAKVSQDIQAIVDAVSQLREQQASLTDEMRQIQERAFRQTGDIITAIQQLKQAPVEAKISDSRTDVSDSSASISSSGTKLESSVAEVAAK
jgi:hypothetical protein